MRPKLTVAELARCDSGLAQRWGIGVKQAVAWRKSETQGRRTGKNGGKEEVKRGFAFTLAAVRGSEC